MYSGIFLVLLLAFAAFCYIKPRTQAYSFFNRTWGFDHITLYSLAGQVTFYIVSLAVIFPFLNKKLLNVLVFIAERLKQLLRKKELMYLLAALGSFFIFYALRIKYFFLGDFNLRMEQVVRKEFLPTEYLTMRLLYYFTQLAAKFGYATRTAFELYSCLAGSVFVYFSCLIADGLAKDKTQKLLLFLSQICSSLLLVFFGYIEIYATPILLLTVYIYFALRYYSSKKGFSLAVIFLLLAVASHLLCLAALPSLLVLWYFNNKKKVNFIATMSNQKIAFFISTLVLTAFYFALTAGSSFVLPLKQPPELIYYITFFSSRHFWEIANGQLLSSGLFFVFVAFIFYQVIVNKIKLEAPVYFLFCLAGCFKIIILLANLHRGSCDWDIMGFNAIPLNLLAASLILILYQKQPSLANYILFTIVSLNLLNTFLWIDINHSDRSIKKIEEMLTKDPGTYYSSKLPSEIELMILYKSNNLRNEAERVGWQVCENSYGDDVKPCILHGRNLNLFGKPDAAKVVFENILTRSHKNPEPYLWLVDYYNKRNQKEMTLFYMNAFFDAFLLNPNIFLNYPEVKPEGFPAVFGIIYNEAVKSNDQRRAAQINEVLQNLSKINLKRPLKVSTASGALQ